MPENSFDIVSKIELQEVSNAIQQALKEVHTRFDLKDSKSDIKLEGSEAIVLSSVDEYKLKAVNDVLQQKLVRRGVPLKGLTYSALEPAAGGTVRQRITMQQGIPIEKAREIVKLIKNSKKKVQASIQGDLVRVSGKDRDVLQEIIAPPPEKRPSICCATLSPPSSASLGATRSRMSAPSPILANTCAPEEASAFVRRCCCWHRDYFPIKPTPTAKTGAR